MNSELRRKILLSVVFALLVYIGLALYSDWSKLSTALVEFPWSWLPVVLGLTLVNYVGRLLRWHWYLRILNVPISRWDSGRVFGVGMLMVMTPGKAGELLKSYMIKSLTGTGMSVTAPAILVERLTDGAAMLLLASAGLLAFPNVAARWIAILVMLSFLGVVVVVQFRPLALRLLDYGRHLPVVKKFAGHLYVFYESSYTLFRPRNLGIGLALGTLFWAAEGAAYYYVAVGFGAPPGLQTLWIAIFIFCISTVIGAVIAMPGGLGGVEGSLVALSIQLLGMTTAVATAAALLVRFCTLWLGVLIGVASFLAWPQLLAGSEPAPPSPATPQQGEV
jgi:glycosyltransferase 2 family protein